MTELARGTARRATGWVRAVVRVKQRVGEATVTRTVEEMVMVGEEMGAAMPTAVAMAVTQRAAAPMATR